MKKVLSFVKKNFLLVILPVMLIGSLLTYSFAIRPLFDEGWDKTSQEVTPSLQEQVDTVVTEGTTELLTKDETVNVANIGVNAPDEMLAPVNTVDVATFEKMISANNGSINVSSVNPDEHVIALAVKDDDKSTIYVTTYLDVQLEQLYAGLNDAGSSINIIYSDSSVVTPVAPRGPAGDTTGANNSTPSASAWSLSPNNILTFLLIGVLVWFIVSFFLRRSREAKMINKTSTISGQKGEGKKGEQGNIEIPETRFTDLAGVDEAVEDMQELVDFLRNPQRFEVLGAKPPKGALLVGPPGTGKTMLARAVAGEAGVPFYNVAGSDFVEMYVGVGAKRVRELFNKARKHENGAIVFIDEIDSIGRSRSSSTAGNVNSEQENTLNALLVELDGFKQSKVVILGATNRDDLLDKALLRPGRLDRKIHVPLPDRVGREKILTVHSMDKPLSGNVNIGLVARRTPGLSGAELAQIVNEAAMVAGRENRTLIIDKDFDEAIALVTMGKGRKSAVVSDEDKMLTAWHEAGHAICGLVQVEAVNPVAISILPRSFAGGVTHFPARDSGYMTRRQAYSQLVTAMGGMAAEQLHIGGGEFTTGPSSDLEQGSKLAFAMVTQYGMGETLFVKHDGILRASETATDEAVQASEELLRKALEDAKLILTSHIDIVNAFVDALIERETLSQLEIEELMAGHTLEPLESAPPAPRQNFDSVNGRTPVINDVVFDTPERKRTGVLSPILNMFKPKRRGYKV